MCNCFEFLALFNDFSMYLPQLIHDCSFLHLAQTISRFHVSFSNVTSVADIVPFNAVKKKHYNTTHIILIASHLNLCKISLKLYIKLKFPSIEPTSVAMAMQLS
jgi:hypothetical protein